MSSIGIGSCWTGPVVRERSRTGKRIAASAGRPSRHRWSARWRSDPTGVPSGAGAGAQSAQRTPPWRAWTGTLAMSVRRSRCCGLAGGSPHRRAPATSPRTSSRPDTDRTRTDPIIDGADQGQGAGLGEQLADTVDGRVTAGCTMRASPVEEGPPLDHLVAKGRRPTTGHRWRDCGLIGRACSCSPTP